jgi:hypothetical protein
MIVGLLAIRLGGGFARVAGDFSGTTLTGGVQVEVWLRPMLLGLLAGALFAFAVRPWRRARAYRLLPVLIVGLAPAILLAVQLWIFFDISQLGATGFKGDVVHLAFTYFPFPLPAILLGLALTAGVIEPDSKNGTAGETASELGAAVDESQTA